MNWESFKRAFSKHIKSDADNYQIRRGKVEEAIGELGKAIAFMKKNRSLEADRFEDEQAELEQQLADADDVAGKSPKEAYAILDAVKKKARAMAHEGKLQAKKTPMRTTVEGEDGPVAVQVFGPDIPGYDKMDEAAQAAAVEKAAKKIGEGKQLLDSILDPATDIDDLPAPDRKAIADLAWYLKSKAQEMIGEPYERGGLTIPDPDNKLRKYIDRCQDIYVRQSSHLQSQQDKPGGKPRGIDFYDGVAEGEDKDEDHLLPNGMRTMLVQQVKTAKGEDRLFVKMETESARLSPGTPGSEDDDDAPESRPWDSADVGRTLAHGWNFVKSKLGMSQGEDDELVATREKINKSVKSAYKKALHSAKKRKKKYPEAYACLKTGEIDIEQIAANFEALEGVEMSGDTAKRLTKCSDILLKKLQVLDTGSRFGDEVVLDAESLTGKGRVDPAEAMDQVKAMAARISRCKVTDRLAVLEKTLREGVQLIESLQPQRGVASDEQLMDALKDLDRQLAGLAKLKNQALAWNEAVAVLEQHMAAVEKCQHTDDPEDLKEVHDEAGRDIARIRKSPTARDHRVSSAIRKLEAQLEPLERLIENLLEEKEEEDEEEEEAELV